LPLAQSTSSDSDRFGASSFLKIDQADSRTAFAVNAQLDPQDP